METRAELAVLCSYVENQAMLEPILLYWASRCKQTKEQGSENGLRTHIFIFSWDYCQLFFFSSVKMQTKQDNRLQFVKETQINTV